MPVVFSTPELNGDMYIFETYPVERKAERGSGSNNGFNPRIGDPGTNRRHERRSGNDVCLLEYLTQIMIGMVNAIRVNLAKVRQGSCRNEDCEAAV